MGLNQRDTRARWQRSTLAEKWLPSQTQAAGAGHFEYSGSRVWMGPFQLFQVLSIICLALGVLEVSPTDQGPTV